MCVKKRTNIVLASKKNKVLLELIQNAKIQFFLLSSGELSEKFPRNYSVFHFIQ